MEIQQGAVDEVLKTPSALMVVDVSWAELNLYVDPVTPAGMDSASSSAGTPVVTEHQIM